MSATKLNEADYLFSPSMIPRHEDPELLARPLHIGDFDRGYVQLLNQLTDAGVVTREAWQSRFREMQAAKDVYYVAVLEQIATQRVVAAATLFVEKKVVHGCAKAGHIEDVVVDSSLRGKQLGKRIIDLLLGVGRTTGCYKVILDCSEKNVPFYAKCGFTRKEVQMAHYINPTAPAKL